MTPEETLKQTGDYLKELKAMRSMHVVVGLPKDKVGGKIYGEGTTVMQIAAAHEYGATIKHPGGTPYIMTGGKARFVKKSFMGPVAGVTGPHTINIPRRSFLNLPFSLKKKEIAKAIDKQSESVFGGKRTAEDALNIIGVEMVNISKGAFTTQGYGKWPRSKKSGGQTLIDTGTLRKSITWQVRNG